MSASINGSRLTSFYSLRGEPQPLGLVVADITRQGVDGHAYRKNAKRARPFQMLAIRDCDDASDAQTIFSALLDMQGSLVTVTDDFGVEYDNVMLLGVEEVSRVKLALAVGGLSTSKTILATWRVEMQIAKDLGD